MKRIALILSVVAMVVLFTVPPLTAADMTAKQLVEDAKKDICEVSVSEAKDLFDKGGNLFLDCRTSKEYKMGHVPGAVNIPRGLLEFKIDKQIPDRETAIIMYCKTGGRGCLATCTLCKMGYKNVKNMDGGWLAWDKAGYPVE
ncbi:MAG: rhodanese-like domain-containing protein [Deltaproteobacteria bacterium]